MATITLTVQEFLNFKKIFKDRFNSKVLKGQVIVTANAIQLSYLGYL